MIVHKPIKIDAVRYFILVFLFTSLGCSNGTQETMDSQIDTQPASVIPLQPLHKSFYPDAQAQVSYADITSLPFEASQRMVSYGTSSLQKAEYWRPTSQTGRPNLPAIIFIHGGCWSNAFRIEQSYPFATALALNGFHVWSLEYSATGDEGGGWPDTFNDIKTGINTIISNADNDDSERPYIVIGHSAGGHLALLALSDDSLEFNVVGLAAIVDITQYAMSQNTCSGSAQSFMGGSPQNNQLAYNDATPNISVLGARTLLFQGANDGIVPASQGINSGLTVITNAQAGHFDWIHPGTAAFDQLLAELLRAQ